MVLRERYRVCKLEQNCRESGIWPERSICGSWRVMKRFSPSFQLEAPTKLQLKPTLSLLKVHDESLRCGSHKVSLTPRRRLTSSSRDSTKTTMRIAKTLARIEALEYSVQSASVRLSLALPHGRLSPPLHLTRLIVIPPHPRASAHRDGYFVVAGALSLSRLSSLPTSWSLGRRGSPLTLPTLTSPQPSWSLRHNSPITLLSSRLSTFGCGSPTHLFALNDQYITCPQLYMHKSDIVRYQLYINSFHFMRLA
ncbi:hypothetical protein Syun_031803 [Stephania yunnanensis]|uniref:Uncharacterized protein n=1 Tax=Stephania yunnanensis TaxID=152371 RepID=A0AAP0DYW7_9MAGN